jgi:uncharacterized membrane protein YdcZ (DUF606 family)
MLETTNRFIVFVAVFGWRKAIQALLILSVISFGGGFVCLLLKIWVLKDKKELLPAALLSTFAGGEFKGRIHTK